MKSVHEILEDLEQGKILLCDAEQLLRTQYIEHIDGQVQLDVFCHRRTGIPEVIFAESKTPEITVEIIDKMLEKNEFALVSRLLPVHKEAIESRFASDSSVILEISDQGRVAFIHKDTYQIPVRDGKVGIITAGTSDIPIAEEARLILNAMGIQTMQVYDVGIAGMHRIFPPLKEMIDKDVDAIIVIAGMEGTLPGVISSLVDIPVIGVPASTGYGLGAHGQGALTTMLQSCLPGLAIVNIDNGFGAAALASLIVKRIYEKKQSE